MNNFRCRICRKVLFTEKNLLDPKGDPFDNVYGTRLSGCTDTQWFLNPDEDLEWLNTSEVQINYLKGKLSCQYCTSRIGSYDFKNQTMCNCQNHNLPFIRVCKNRVDIDFPIQMPKSIDKNEEKKTLNFTNLPNFIFDEIEDELTCSICLELLYLPHYCDPCKHIFCGPCLRRLNTTYFLYINCPLCREKIHQCIPDFKMSKLIKIKYEKTFLLRHEMEENMAHRLPNLPRIIPADKPKPVNQKLTNANLYVAIIFILFLAILGSVVILIVFAGLMQLFWQLLNDFYNDFGRPVDILH